MPNFTGTPEDDSLTGSDSPDTMSGLAGNDTLAGLGGNDMLDGGTGADQMLGGNGDDTYYIDNFGDVVVENSGEGVDLVYTSVSYGLGNNVERAAVTDAASTYAITINGNALNNEISGNAGANYLDGAAGADILRGFAGDDTYIVDNNGDTVVENDGDGIDTIYATATYTLPANVERLGVNGFATSFAIDLTGNSLDNEIWGNNGANRIDGGIGADIMRGGGGDDRYFVDNVGDLVVELSGGGNDRVETAISYVLGENLESLSALESPNATYLTGNDLANSISGNSSANVLDGRAGADTMGGFMGDDVYIVDNLLDQVWEGANQGLDTIYTSVTNYVLPANVERIGVNGFSTTYAIDLKGNDLANEIWGNDGANVINGGRGIDIMRGNGGDDSYYVDVTEDLIIETAGGGLDTVYMYVYFEKFNDYQYFGPTKYTLPSNVERLAVSDPIADLAIQLTGNALDNELWGNNGANVIDGKAGADIMRGYQGNDVYIVDNAGDVVVDSKGVDTIWSSVSYMLGSGVERLGVDGFTTTYAISLAGNDQANEIWGNAGANILDGKGGADILHGNGGADTFAFTSALDNFNVDQLIGFAVGDDKIALDHAVFIGLGLGALAPGAFTVGTAESHGDARIIYNSTTGGIYFDADGSDTGVAVQFATVHEGLPLSASDFMVI